MAAVHHFGFVGGSRGTTHESPFIGTIPCKKNRHDGHSGVEVISIWLFVIHAWKSYLLEHKFQFLGAWLSNLGEHCSHPKRHILVENEAFWAVFGPDRMHRAVALPTVHTVFQKNNVFDYFA